MLCLLPAKKAWGCGKAPGGVDSHVAWAYHQSQERWRTRTASLRVEMGNSGYLLSSEARKTTMLAISSGSPILCKGIPAK